MTTKYQSTAQRRLNIDFHDTHEGLKKGSDFSNSLRGRIGKVINMAQAPMGGPKQIGRLLQHLGAGKKFPRQVTITKPVGKTQIGTAQTLYRQPPKPGRTNVKHQRDL